VNCIRLEKAGDIEKCAPFRQGLFHVQDISSQLCCLTLRPVVNETVLDVCAAPGGKSFTLAELMGNNGKLYSMDLHDMRVGLIEDGAARLGIKIITAMQNDASKFNGALPQADRVLCDVPCSGFGVIRRKPEIKYKPPEEFAGLPEIQYRILETSARYVKSGGTLVYSTCTFAPEEDEGQVAAFLQRHPEFTLADALGNVDYTFGSEGEANRTGGLPLDVSKVRRIWPCQGGEGHFMARLIKAGTPRVLPAEGEYTAEEQLWLAAAEAAGKKAKGKGGKPAKTPDARSARRENARACREAVQGEKRSREAQAGETSPAQSLAAWHAFAGQYFPALVDRPAVVHGSGVLLPVPFPQTNLHVLRAGVFVGSVQKGRFVPEHHLFTAFGAQCVNREELTLDDPRCVEYLSGREVEARIAADGWCCVTVDGWPLGGGKVSGGRVKNHYPKALRLL
jgi:NOL1/NOP2/fmu family ribosome biogenesis protein